MVSAATSWPGSVRLVRSIAGVLAVGMVALGSLGCSSGGGSESQRGPTTVTTPTTGSSGGSIERPAGAPGTLDRYAGFSSETYENLDSWLCRPDVPDDICDSDLDTTVVAPDGTLTVERWEADPQAPIDCFYVYPTISRDPTTYSDMDASDDEEGAAAVNQVARLGSECRVFAPIYRQRTLAGLASAIGGVSSLENNGTSEGDTSEGDTSEGDTDRPGPTTPFNDVLEAWKSYMARDNEGRGVVFIGHSQGSAILSQLLASEVDPNPDVRDRLVGAYLAGWGIGVRADGKPGGDLPNIPLCNEPGQIRCLVTWATYRKSSPPPADALFGRLRASSDDLLVAGCVNPADIRAGSGAAPVLAHGYFPADGGASILAGQAADNDPMVAARAWIDPATQPITTRFVSAPGLLSVRCAEHDGAHFLELTNNTDDGPRVDDIAGDMNAQWGMHLQDVNIVMGNVVDNVRAQAAGYLSRH